MPVCARMPEPVYNEELTRREPLMALERENQAVDAFAIIFVMPTRWRPE